MKLQSINGQFVVPDRSKWAGAGLSNGFEYLADAGDLIPMTHPDVHLTWKACENPGVVMDFACSGSILTARSVIYFSTESFAG